MTSDRLQYLLERNAAKACTRQELEELYAEIAASPDEKLFLHLDTQYEKIPAGVEVADVDWEYMFAAIVSSAQRKRGALLVTWRRVAVAASILLVIGVGGYWLLQTKDRKTGVTQTNLPADIKAPQTNRAMITLADGSQVYLDSAVNGQLAMQGNVQLVKLANGQIAYNNTDSKGLAEIRYNTLTNPRGSRVIDMVLSDGSHVWLNAGSSVTYPIAFVGNERKITITGEAYFEVAHDADRPFYVTKGDMQVQVLGTHFNVNAYDDENAVKVTLLEGSVKIVDRQPVPLSGGSSEQSVILQPGEQAAITTNHKLQTTNKIDTDQVIAWTIGFFQFDNLDIKTILRQLSRWYNVDVAWETVATPRLFGGRISNQLNLSEVLRLLEANDIHFRFDGRKIIVLP